MAEGMSTDELREIRDSLVGITPGPWRNVSGRGAAVVTSDDRALGCQVHAIYAEADTMPETLGRWKADARFIANARNMMPRLLAEIERLRTGATERERELLEEIEQLRSAASHPAAHAATTTQRTETDE